MEVFDCLGIGFGPTNLALAIAFNELMGSRGFELTYAFVDDKPCFDWQSELLLPDTKMTTCFWEDLVTVRNPQSRFTFINYLKEHNRLFEFMNLRDFYPSRFDFTAYLKWCANLLAAPVFYNTRTAKICFVDEGHWRITCERGALKSDICARTIVLSIGRRPRIPAAMGSDLLKPFVFHSSEYRSKFISHFIPGDSEHTFILIGVGQSAGDILQHLLVSFPRARIHVLLRSFALRPFDDTPFVNEMFKPEFVDLAYRSYQAEQGSIEKAYDATNYAVIDTGQLRFLYRFIYEEALRKIYRITFHRFSEVTTVSPASGKCVAAVTSSISGMRQEIQADAILCATGFDLGNFDELLQGISPHIVLDGFGQPKIRRDYSLETVGAGDATIFIQALSRCRAETPDATD